MLPKTIRLSLLLALCLGPACLLDSQGQGTPDDSGSEDGDFTADGDGDTDSDADSDTDTDVDSDSDTDTDVDTDTDTDTDSDTDGDADSCVPDCSGRSCGDDGCGGSCSPGCDSEARCVEATGRCSVAAGDWVIIPAGTFWMGSPPGEYGREIGFAEESRHEVTLTRDFLIRSTPVTQGDYGELMGSNPSTHWGCGDDCPVESVSWNDAARYANALSVADGLAECYQCPGGRDCDLSAAFATPYDCEGYRLPTEAEWEYAARAGTSTATYNGDIDARICEYSAVIGPIAWYCGNAEGPHPVGRMRPNDWGLFDMLGNVWEMCHDRYEVDLGLEGVVDPWGPTIGGKRVNRGGAFTSGVEKVRAAYREADPPEIVYYSMGFRPVRTRLP